MLFPVDGVASDELWIVNHSVGAIDWAGGDAGVGHDGVDLGDGVLARPVADERVEFGLARPTRMMRLEARVFGPLRLADGFGEAGEGFLRMALVENENRLRQAVRQIGRCLDRESRNGQPDDSSRPIST